MTVLPGGREIKDVDLVDASGNPIDPTSALPAGATQVNASSGAVANATAAASLPAVSAKTNYLSGFEVTGSGATAALPVSVTVSGVLGGPLTYIYDFAAGALVGNQPLTLMFNPPLQGAGVNTAITVSCPAGGAGNAHNSVNVHGYVK